MTTDIRPVAVVIHGDDTCGPTCQNPEYQRNHHSCLRGTHGDTYYCECDECEGYAYFRADDMDSDAWCHPCANDDHTHHTFKSPTRTIRSSWS
jgi:hypothetical protein